MAKKKTKKKKSGGVKTAARRERASVAGDVGRKEMERTAAAVRSQILAGEKPELKFPLRSLRNVRYDPKDGYLELGRGTKSRTLTVNTVRNFAQILRTLGFLATSVLPQGDFSNKREIYYNSKGSWGDAKFENQPESDAILEDIEALFQMNREQLGMIPDEHGGYIVGNLTIIDTDPLTGGEIRIDCRRQGTGSYTTPPQVEHLGFETSADFVLVIETNAMFDRLNRHAFWDKHNCVLVSMSGVPTRACRRLLRRLSDECKIPVYVFTDCDPYGICNIYRTLKVGSGNAAHINKYFCVPQARFLGVTPQDIFDYDLPADKLDDRGIKRAKDALKNDPFFQHYKTWQKTLQMFIKHQFRAEQQIFASKSLNFVLEEYLPEKLRDPGKFLP